MLAGIAIGSTNAAAATKTWDGSTSNLWSVASNWVENVVPAASDDLVFPANAQNQSNQNNLAPNTTFKSIQITGGSYTISGNAIVLNGSIVHSSTGSSTISLPVGLTSGLISIDPPVVHDVDVSGGPLTINGVISGCDFVSFACDLRKLGGGTLVLAGSNTYGAPTYVNAGTLRITNAAALGGIALTQVAAGAMLELAAGGTTPEQLRLNGSGIGGAGAVNATVGGVTLNGTVVLNSDSAIGATDSLTLSGFLLSSLDFGLTKVGAGTLTLTGAFDNFHTGTTTVAAGTLRLAMTAGAEAIGGPLVIGDGVGGAEADVVILQNAGQMPPTVPVTISSSGKLDFNGFDQGVGPVTMAGGRITGNGMMFLSGNVSATGPVVSQIGVQLLSLEGQVRTFDVAGGSGLSVGSSMVDVTNGFQSIGGILATGAGELTLGGANTYTGPTTINGGAVVVTHPSALGSTVAGTTIGTGTSLEFRVANPAAEPLVVVGGGRIDCDVLNVLFPGAITVQGSAIIATPAACTVGGAISGPGSISKIDTATLTLSAANTYAGATTVMAGTLRVGSPGAIPNASAVSISAGATFDLNSAPETIGSLAGAGTVSLGAGILTTGGNSLSTMFSGRISGSGGLVKVGAGTLTLAGAGTYSGSTIVDQGRLDVTGSIARSVVADGGTVGGTGSVGPLSAIGGAVSPGLSPGTLTANGNTTLDSSSTLAVEINGPAAGQYDRLSVFGAVNLGGAALNVTPNFSPASATRFTIVANDSADAVINTFSGLPEGAILNAGGTGFRISYAGGDGNDVVLAAVPLTHYLSEGATSTFFDTAIALVNPNAGAAANTTLSFQLREGAPVSDNLVVPPRSRLTVDPKKIDGLETAEFSTVVSSDQPIVVDRTMRWDASGYGSHAETSVPGPALTWYLAEGATHSGFNLFYLIQNPQPTAATVTVTYLRPSPAPALVKAYPVGPNSRFNIWVNSEAVVDPALAGLAGAEISAILCRQVGHRRARDVSGYRGEALRRRPRERRRDRTGDELVSG
jgi:autotransporter-associated beta strand protein